MYCLLTPGRIALALVLALAGMNRIALADDAATKPQDAAAVWNQAESEIDRIEKQLQSLQEEFQKAQPDQQAKLRDEAMKLVDTLMRQFQAIGEAVPSEYATRATQPAPAGDKAKALAQQALGLAFQQNRYADALKIAEPMLAVDPKNAAALNVAGVSQFATHQFAEAVQRLQKGKDENLLIPELGGHYLGTAQNYVKFWEEERAIREQEAALTGDQQLPRVLFKTSRGNILLELFEDHAPNTVANFISLVEKGYYSNSPFHRVIPNFMAQGGMPGKNPGIEQGPGYTIECECYRPDKRRHFAGSLSMAHAGKDTGGSQFFITHLPTAHLDGPNSFHTVFGRVVEGMDVVAAIQQGDTILSAEVVRKRSHPYQPVTKGK